jgi:hypothetical protein
MATTSVYDNNQFAYRKTSRNQAISNKPQKMKRHLPLWFEALLILALIAVAGTVGYILTHPSPHRSPVAIATDFIEKVSAGNYVGAASDVDPADRAKALSLMQSQNGVPGGFFTGIHSTKVGSSNVTGDTGSAVIQACNASLACVDLPAVPSVKVDGSWYVSWIPLLQSTAT